MGLNPAFLVEIIRGTADEADLTRVSTGEEDIITGDSRELATDTGRFEGGGIAIADEVLALSPSRFVSLLEGERAR